MSRTVDRRETWTVKGKQVKGCRLPTCETVIPDSDEAGVETGYCSEECHTDPRAMAELEDDEEE